MLRINDTDNKFLLKSNKNLKKLKLSYTRGFTGNELISQIENLKNHFWKHTKRNQI